MDKTLKNFIGLFSGILFLFIILTTIFIYFYKYSSLNTYNSILIFLIALSIIITVIFIFTGLVFFLTYQKRRVLKGLSWALALGLRVTMPFLIQAAGMMKRNKDGMRRLYVDVNNIYVSSANKKYHPRDVLILLPHCLQNSDCSIKVTQDVSSCKDCGKCNIGGIKALAKERGVKLRVVTGGTVARKIVRTDQPKLILSVACERDLTSGMMDVGSIPVLGVVNDRPNGPCFNTFVNLEELEDKLNCLLKDS